MMFRTKEEKKKDGVVSSFSLFNRALLPLSDFDRGGGKKKNEPRGWKREEERQEKTAEQRASVVFQTRCPSRQKSSRSISYSPSPPEPEARGKERKASCCRLSGEG